MVSNNFLLNDEDTCVLSSVGYANLVTKVELQQGDSFLGWTGIKISVLL